MYSKEMKAGTQRLICILISQQHHIHNSKYWHKLQHGWTLKTCSMKQARHKRTNIVSVHFYEVPSIDQFIGTERIIVVARSWRKRMVNYCLTYIVSTGDDDKVLEMDNDDSRTTLWMSLLYLRTLHYPFKNS